MREIDVLSEIMESTGMMRLMAMVDHIDNRLSRSERMSVVESFSDAVRSIERERCARALDEMAMRAPEGCGDRDALLGAAEELRSVR
jgi:hypothetical protein